MRSSGKAPASEELAPGVFVPGEISVTAEDFRGYDVEVTVVPRDGRLVVSEVAMRQRKDGTPVTGEALRQLALTPFIKAALSSAYVKLNVRPDEEPQTLEEALRRQEAGAVAWGLLNIEDRDRLKAAGPVTETLQWVATLYRVAVAIAEPPVRTVQGVFGVSLRTAGNWVSAARQAGLLEAAEGRGGE